MEPMTDERLEEIRRCSKTLEAKRNLVAQELLSEVDRLRENLRSGRCNGCFVGKELAGWRALAEERATVLESLHGMHREAFPACVCGSCVAVRMTPGQALERRKQK